MKKLNIKKVILWTLAMILCVTACGPAFASAGDKILFRSKTNDDGSSETYISGVWKAGDYLYVIGQGRDEKILRFKGLQGEPEEFVVHYDYDEHDHDEDEAEAAEDGTGITPVPQEELPEASGEPEEEDEDEDSFLVTGQAKHDHDHDHEETAENVFESSYVNAYFCWKDELYGLTQKQKYDGTKDTIESLVVKRVKLENGEITLEDSDLPELDPSLVVQSSDDYEYFSGMDHITVVGNYLLGRPYVNGMGTMVAFDLTNGTCKDMGFDYSVNIAEGPDGSLLVSRADWSMEEVTLKVSRMNLEDMNEEPVVEIKGLSDSDVSLCLDQEKNTLYYVASGQLWAMPDLDPEKTVAVNECPESSPSAILLPDGFVLLWTQRTVMIRNTDPEARGNGTTLRVYCSTYNTEAINEAIFQMSNDRGDVSVILAQEWNTNIDILQSMMNRDATTDIYVLPYEGNDFKALRNRGFLTDLSGVAQIAENTDRMYPYLQDAVKKDGKVIAVPMSLSSESFCLNREVWKKIGGTDEMLPKTWTQFLDWVVTLPKMLEGSDYLMTDVYTSQYGFRAGIVQAILNQYQVEMDAQGENYNFNTPLLNDLLKRVEEFDYAALGLPEEVDYEALNMSNEWHESLLDTYGFNGYSSYSQSVPLSLSLAEDRDPVVPVSIYAAFVNPYSEHPEEAKELLALIMKNQDVYTQYTLYADRTEPIERSDADESRANHEKYIEDMKKWMEEADDEYKAMVEESIRQEEKEWEENQRWLWTIHQDDIDTYLKLSPLFRVQTYNIFNDLWGTDEDKERDKLLSGLFGYYGEDEGGNEEKVSISDALALIDQKIQMKRMEGN